MSEKNSSNKQNSSDNDKDLENLKTKRDDARKALRDAVEKLSSKPKEKLLLSEYLAMLPILFAVGTALLLILISSDSLDFRKNASQNHASTIGIIKNLSLEKEDKEDLIMKKDQKIEVFDTNTKKFSCIEFINEVQIEKDGRCEPEL